MKYRKNRFNLSVLPRIAGIVLAGSMLVSAEEPAKTEAKEAAKTENKEPAKAEKTEPKEKPPVLKAAKGSLKIKAQVDGFFESAQMLPIKVTPKVWTDLTVEEAAAHGQKVKKGEPLVKFDTEKLEEQISDLENDRNASKLAFELAEADLKNAREVTPIKLDTARRTQKSSTEDYDYFVTVGRAQREKASSYNLKGAEQRLENASEELDQLEKMYKADEITEETEEIVLKRQKYQVDYAQYALEAVKLSVKRELEVLLPREHENLKTQKREQELALQLSEISMPRNLAKKELDFEKTKRDQKKAEKKLGELKQDLASVMVTAPADGVVYYGALENGKLTTGGVVAKKLIKGGKVSPQEVFMTLVDPDQLIIKAIISEADLANLKAGLKGKAAPVATPDRKLEVEIQEVSFFPLPGGGYEAKMSVNKADATRLVPGMTCKVHFEDLEKNTLIVPKDAVITDGQQKVVYLAKADGSHEKKTVKTGESDEKNIEIVDGLSEGDQFYSKKPE
ncbi:MAG: HlyD family efflux transporter periplasmic adaptor subunit [Verrucomicrobiales bacterium]